MIESARPRHPVELDPSTMIDGIEYLVSLEVLILIDNRIDCRFSNTSSTVGSKAEIMGTDIFNL